MNRSSVGFAGSLVVAVVVGSGLYWLVGDLALAGVTGVVWGSGLALSIHLYRSHPSLGAEPTWERKRWVGVSTGLITLAALIGVSPTLPISAELRLGLGVLVIGTGFVGLVTASLAELERFDG
jgi:hypothetical protein